MFLREMTEELERQTLSPYAALSADSRGARRPIGTLSDPNLLSTGY